MDKAAGYNDYPIMINGREFVLMSADGGASGYVYELGSSRWDLAYACFYSPRMTKNGLQQVHRFRERIAEGLEIEVGHCLGASPGVFATLSEPVEVAMLRSNGRAPQGLPS